VKEEWKINKRLVGTTSKERALWLMGQMNSAQQAVGLPLAEVIAQEDEWAAFLEGEGLSQSKASKLAIGRVVWIQKLQTVLHRLKESGQMKIQFKAERTWELAAGRVVSTCTVDSRSGSHGSNDSSQTEALALTIAMDCLAGHYRFCLRDKCQKLFLAKGKKKYCSHTCALTVAKQKYRKRKEPGKVGF
jgi:hypothetical protein